MDDYILRRLFTPGATGRVIINPEPPAPDIDAEMDDWWISSPLKRKASEDNEDGVDAKKLATAAAVFNAVPEPPPPPPPPKTHLLFSEMKARMNETGDSSELVHTTFAALKRSGFNSFVKERTQEHIKQEGYKPTVMFDMKDKYYEAAKTTIDAKTREEALRRIEHELITVNNRFTKTLPKQEFRPRPQSPNDFDDSEW